MRSIGEAWLRMTKVSPRHVQFYRPIPNFDQYSNILGKTCLKNNKSDDVVTFFTYLPTVMDTFSDKISQILPKFDLSQPSQALAVVLVSPE